MLQAAEARSVFATSLRTLLDSNLNPHSTGWLALNELSSSVFPKPSKRSKRSVLSSTSSKAPPSYYAGPKHYLARNTTKKGGSKQYQMPPPASFDWRSYNRLTPVSHLS